MRFLGVIRTTFITWLHRIPFFWRLMAFAMVLILAISTCSAVVAVQSLRTRLARELLAVVISTAPLIDGDLHELIHRGEKGEPRPDEEFEQLRQQLNAVKSANQLTGPGSPIYTFRKADDYDQTGELEFVVMTDREQDGTYSVGHRYVAQPHLRRALEGIPSTTNVYEDSEGSWISAAAPIRDHKGNIVGVLQADRPLSFFVRECRAQLWALFLGSGLTLAAGGLLAFGLARAVELPLQELVHATKSLSEGHLETRVPVHAADEIGLLAQSFNSMAAELQSASARDQARMAKIQKMVDSVKEAKVFFHSLVNSLPLYLFRKDLSGHYTFVNNLACARLGKTLEDFLGRGDEGFVEPDRVKAWREIEQRVARERITLEAEEVFHGPAGIAFYFHIIRSPVLNPDGAVVGTQGIVLDITVRKKAEQELASTQARLLEASRMAGKAEVATNVLHNVGNVLNSVNVSSSVIIEMLRKSKTPGLGKAVKLIRDHEADLATYLANDAKGKQLPAFLEALSRQLTWEQEKISEEMQHVQQNIDHIKQLVLMQQSSAKPCGVMEVLNPQDLIEDAIQICSSALTRHRVNLKREFQPVPPVLVDRHLLMQILVNLITNAKEALDQRTEERRVVIRVAPAERDSVRIEVSDNGTGISNETLPRIFQHGFTTKATGHGFGLHSSAIAAKEMGGAIVARSDGPDQGATFVLEFPAHHAGAKVLTAESDTVSGGIDRVA